MFTSKLFIMSFALFAVIFAVSGEEISDRRFRWEGSNDQLPDEKEAEINALEDAEINDLSDQQILQDVADDDVMLEDAVQDDDDSNSSD